MATAGRQFASPADADLQLVLENALDAYVCMDESGRIVDWNHQAEDTFGFDRDEVIGKPLADVIIPHRYRDAHWRGLAHFLKTGQGPVLNRRLRLAALHRDGREFPVEFTIRPLRAGSSWTFHAFLRDVTELHEAQKRALQWERQAAIAEIISRLAQDSSDALQQMQMGIDLLALELGERVKAEQHIGRIQQARDRLESLLKDVHSSAIPLRLNPREWDLADIWPEAWEQLAVQREGRSIELAVDIADANLACTVDRVGIGQLFRILFQNSIKRCSDPVRIEIHCQDDAINGGPAIRIAVRDRGPPLPGNQWQQVFTMPDLTRVDEPGAELAIAARIVDAHGGRMTVSGRYRRGAEFVITLPRSASEPQA